MNPDDNLVAVYYDCPNCGGPIQIQVNPKDYSDISTEKICEDCERAMKRLNDKIKNKGVEPSEDIIMRDICEVLEKMFRQGGHRK